MELSYFSGKPGPKGVGLLVFALAHHCQEADGALAMLLHSSAALQYGNLVFRLGEYDALADTLLHWTESSVEWVFALQVFPQLSALYSLLR